MSVDTTERDLSDEGATRLWRITDGEQYPDKVRDEARRMLAVKTI